MSQEQEWESNNNPALPGGVYLPRDPHFPHTPSPDEPGLESPGAHAQEVYTTASQQQSLRFPTHKSELYSISGILLKVHSDLLILIITLRAPEVDELPLLFTKWRQPERTSCDSWHQLGGGLVVKGLRLIRQSSSSSSRAYFSLLFIVPELLFIVHR